MKYITINKTSHARVAAATRTGILNDETTIYLPDGNVKVLVDEEVYAALASRIDAITPTFDAVIASLFSNNQ